MKECHCVIACTVWERGPARGNGVKKKKKEGKERCTRQLLCPRALPRNVTQCKEQLLGLRRPEGQGWHHRVHILYTHFWIQTHIYPYSCACHTLYLIPFCFLSCPVWVSLEPRREKNRSRECTGKRRFYILLEEELEKPLWDHLNSCLFSRLQE